MEGGAADEGELMTSPPPPFYLEPESHPPEFQSYEPGKIDFFLC